LRPVFSRFTGASICALAAFVLILSSINASSAGTVGPATATVQQLLASIGKLRTTTDASRRDKLISSIDSSLAIDKLSERALGAQWSKLDAQQRAHFIALVKQLLEKIAYPNAAQFFNGLSVDITGEDLHGDRRVVKSKVNRPGSGAVSIDYVLERVGSRWVVVDVILDRQSLADSIASQFQATLKSSSYDDLVAQMQARLAQAPPSPAP
jgi:ABC-type transporter MlaC component